MSRQSGVWTRPKISNGTTHSRTVSLDIHALGKQPWNPASKNKLAYLSNMCRDKSARAEAPFLSDSVGDNIYKTLLKSDIPTEHMPLKPTILAKTAPFGQVSRLTRMVLYESIWPLRSKRMVIAAEIIRVLRPYTLMAKYRIL